MQNTHDLLIGTLSIGTCVYLAVKTVFKGFFIWHAIELEHFKLENLNL